MKKIVIALLFILLSSSVFAQQKDIAGWKNTRWGMTEDEIINACSSSGNLSKYDTPQKYNLNGNSNAGYSSIMMESIAINSDMYAVDFVMDNKTRRLIAVVLNASEKGADQRQFQRLSQTLTEKYGKPTYVNEDRTPDRRLSSGSLPGSDDFKRVWTLPSTTIELTFLDIRTITSSLKIIYRQSSRGVKDNL